MKRDQETTNTEYSYFVLLQKQCCCYNQTSFAVWCKLFWNWFFSTLCFCFVFFNIFLEYSGSAKCHFSQLQKDISIISYSWLQNNREIIIGSVVVMVNPQFICFSLTTPQNELVISLLQHVYAYPFIVLCEYEFNLNRNWTELSWSDLKHL